MKKKTVEGMPLFRQCGDHSHFAGTVDGTFYEVDDTPNDEGEIVYEAKDSKSTVGGGNPVYAKRYDEMNWDN